MWVACIAEHCLIGCLDRGADLTPCSHAKVVREKPRNAACIRRNDLSERKTVDGTNETAIAGHDAELGETRFKFDRALVVIGDAGDPARIDHVLH
ncbi:hypothetical protein D3C76_1474910 [compost metagenome]